MFYIRSFTYFVLFVLLSTVASSDQDDLPGLSDLPLSNNKIDKATLKCLVCKSLVEEVEVAIDKVDPRKTIETGGYRLDGQGNMKQQTVPYARSEIHLSEVMDLVCDGFKDYTMGRYKATGKPVILRLMTHKGNMNPEIGNIDLTPDPENVSNLSYFCQSIVEDHEDELIKMFTKNQKNPQEELCTKLAKVCPSSGEGLNDNEAYDFEREEL